MAFTPHTKQDIEAMLETLGVKHCHELFDEIPSHLFIDKLEAIAHSQSEMQVKQNITSLHNNLINPVNFQGAGAYEHHIPAAVWDITSRGEFLTAYTPYQAEASQGSLQLIYEYQTMIASLTGMEVANASVYDGATALAEAIFVAIRANKKSKSKHILVLGTLHPRYFETLTTLTQFQNITLTQIPFDLKTGTCDNNALSAFDKQDITALVIQQPNYFGQLESVQAFTQWANDHHVLSIACVNPTTLGLLTAPGNYTEQGVDIVCGEGQPLGIPLASGGPYFGFLCCKKAYVRHMPGRIVGRSIDNQNKPCYTLTLQAREQHIRRSKATSNICTNQGLLVTAATIYMSLLGPIGLKQVASHCHANTKALAASLRAIPGVTQKFQGPFFHETVLSFPKEINLPVLLDSLRLKYNLLGGILLAPDFPALENCLLVCATETKTEQHIEQYQQALLQLTPNKEYKTW